MSPAQNFVISLPIVSTHQVCAQKFSWPKVRINLAFPRNEIKLSTAGAHRHNHHVITYDWVPDFRVCLIPLPSPGLPPHPHTRCRQGRHVWQSQEATHGSWLVRCTPHALGFSHEQSTKYSEYLLENMQGSLRWSRNSRAYIGIFPYWFSVWQINFSWMVDRSWNTMCQIIVQGVLQIHSTFSKWNCHKMYELILIYPVFSQSTEHWDTLMRRRECWHSWINKQLRE